MCDFYDDEIKVVGTENSTNIYSKEFGECELKKFKVSILRTEYHVLNFIVQAPDENEAWEILEDVRCNSDDWVWKNQDNDYEITELD